jgi:periplasmic protein TonB
MERPQHELLAVASKSKQSRATSLGIVIALHIGIIAALVVGLSNNALRQKIVDISASVVAKKVVVKAPPPPPPALVRPPPVASAPPPAIVIAAPPPVVAAPVVKAAPPPPPPPTLLKEITRTHTLPPYPALSQRLGEQGTTHLKVAIGTDGKVTDVQIVTSSGSARLDTAAAQWVKDHYTWQPPTQDGKPVAASALVDVVWDLKNAS